MSWFKFLGHDATAPFSGRPWPQPSGGRPGEWMTWPGPRDPCRAGLHVCRLADLPLWMNEELFAVEVDGEVDEYSTFAVTARARLSARIEDWGFETAHRLSDDCAWRTRTLAVETLRLEGRDPEAARLLLCRTADELRLVADQVAHGEHFGHDGRLSAPLAGYAADAAAFADRVRAGGSWPAATATTAFIAATAARVAAGGGGSVAESADRALQARWLEQQVVHTS